MPHYENWDEYIMLYPSQEGIKKEPALVWKNPNPNNITNHVAGKNPDRLTRDEKKTRKAL